MVAVRIVNSGTSSVHALPVELPRNWNYRIKDLGWHLASIHKDLEEDNLSIKWEFDDDEAPKKVILELSSYDYRNTSCHCHPEYELHTEERRFEIPLEEITNDDYWCLDMYGGVQDTVMDNHPALERLREEQLTEKERKEREARLRKEAEERARREEQERRERAEFERLKSKFGN